MASPHFEATRHDVTFPLYVEVDQILTLTGEPRSPSGLQVGFAGIQHLPLPIGSNEISLATREIRAQELKPVLLFMALKRLFYLVAYFKAGFYAWSSNYALAPAGVFRRMAWGETRG